MVADELTLARLTALAQSGDRVAYVAMLKEAARWLKRYFYRRVPPQQLDDLVQDTLLSVHHKLANYDPARPFLPWLAAVARYRWVDHLHRMYRIEEIHSDIDVGEAGPEDEIMARVSLTKLIAMLPPAQARAITMVKIDGKSVAETASTTGQSESLVKVNIHRGLKKLTTLVEKCDLP